MCYRGGGKLKKYYGNIAHMHGITTRILVLGGCMLWFLSFSNITKDSWL